MMMNFLVQLDCTETSVQKILKAHFVCLRNDCFVRALT